MRSHIHLAIRHDEVLDKTGSLVDSSITQVDLHDLCRLARTYGLGSVRCITRLPSQQSLVRKMLGFWHEGAGRDYNPKRRDALSLLHLHDSFDQCLESLQGENAKPPLVIGTSARIHQKNLEFQQLSNIMLSSGRQTVLVFGTAWGLSETQLHRCDGVLPAVQGYDGFNHLSVRCAAAILIDRLFHTPRIELQET